ncbi:MAG: hypothetical protein KDE35_05375 [Geminicoccaceae bacterium]|nr:hypothetical protein [Geminicoccaceae bacterium]
MAIVMAIMGVLTVGGIGLLGGRVEAGREKLTATRLDGALEALIAYYVWQGRLPCPADGSLAVGDAAYGRARPETAGPCDTTAVTGIERIVPWRTLGLSEAEASDGWGRRLSYHVSPALTATGSVAPGSLVVRDGAAATAGTAELTDRAALVLFSHGANGRGGWTTAGARLPVTGASVHEQMNTDGAAPFADRRTTGILDAAFDDMLVWRERPQLARATGAAFNGGTCTAADGVWSGEGCAATPSTDACIVAAAVRARCG